MYDIHDLNRATGYSKDQLRDRLSLLEATLAHDRQQGSRGKILVGDPTLATLKRVKELEADGLAPKVAVDQVILELGSTDLVSDPNLAEGQPQSSTMADMLIDELRKDKDHLRKLLSERDTELARITALLESSQDQVQAMLPPSSEGRRRLSRLQALRIALLGR